MGNIMTVLEECTERINDVVWGIPLILVIIFIGIKFTFGFGFVQFKKIPLALKLLFKSEDGGEAGSVSRFGALATSLAAMIGTGNIIGVATAVFSGGAGAIVWMLIASLLGMAISYAEGFLAVKYRRGDGAGKVLGGAFMYIELGMGRRFIPLAKAFALFCGAAAILGMGTLTQVNGIASAAADLIDAQGKYNIQIFKTDISAVKLICAVVVTFLAGRIVFGGIESISEVSERIVPIMGGMYVAATLAVLICCADRVPAAMCEIIASAFTGRAALGGFCGAAVAQAMRMGVARGIFSNEAGLGSASIAAASARVSHPAEQGMLSMVGTFIDTTVLCTMTGVAIVVSGALESGLNGVALTNLAYSQGFPFAPWLGRGIVSAALILFAFASVLGWNYYGEQCAEYLAGKRAIKPYRVLYLIAVFVGCFLELDLVWNIADILNGLMAIPNLIALLALYPVVKKETRKYWDQNKKSASW